MNSIMLGFFLFVVVGSGASGPLKPCCSAGPRAQLAHARCPVRWRMRACPLHHIASTLNVASGLAMHTSLAAPSLRRERLREVG